MSVICSRGEILTDPGPIKPHRFQELPSLRRIVFIVPHTEQRGLGLNEPFSELLPVRFKEPTTCQHSALLKDPEGEGDIHLRSTKRQPQDKVSDVILPPLLVQFDGFGGTAVKREVLRTLILHNSLELVQWPVPSPG